MASDGADGEQMDGPMGEAIREAIDAEERQAGSLHVATVHPQTRRRGPWLQLRVPHGCEWNRYELGIPGLAGDLEGLRIVHLSDLHFKPFWSGVYERLARRVTEARADLILITGDFVDDKADAMPSLPHVLRFAEGLRARLGVYAILGNHDGDLVGPYLPKAGVTLVENQRVVMGSADGDAGVELIGTTSVGREDMDEVFLRGLPGKRAGWVRIVMSHFPDTLRRVGFLRPDIVLAGHTHGGQVCLPGGVPIIRHDSLPRRLCKGVHRIGGTWLVANRGLGFSSLPLRVFCPAEAIELVLRRETPP